MSAQESDLGKKKKVNNVIIFDMNSIKNRTKTIYISVLCFCKYMLILKLLLMTCLQTGPTEDWESCSTGKQVAGDRIMMGMKALLKKQGRGKRFITVYRDMQIFLHFFFVVVLI